MTPTHPPQGVETALQRGRKQLQVRVVGNMSRRNLTLGKKETTRR